MTLQWPKREDIEFDRANGRGRESNKSRTVHRELLRTPIYSPTPESISGRVALHSDIARAREALAILPPVGKSRLGGCGSFFVLSGFLISGLLFQDFKAYGKINVRRFMLRRGLKIWPPFAVFLGVWAMIFAVGSAAFPLHGFIESLLFVRNYFPSDDPPVGIAHTWSLCVEEHFYLILPVLLVCMVAIRRKSKDPFRVLPMVFAVVAISCLLLRWAYHGPKLYVWKTHERIDSLFAGVTLGYLYHFKEEWFKKVATLPGLALGLLLCAPALILEEGDRLMMTLGLTALALGFGMVVAWAVVHTPRSQGGQIAVRFIATMGLYSYSIYLWHLPIAIYFNLQHRPSALTFWGYVTFAIVIGIAMAKVVETPLLRARERWRLTA